MVRMFDAGMRKDRPAVVHDRVFTVANGITVFRLLGLPLFVYLMVVPEAFGMAFLTLVIVGSTDWVDGYVARRFDQVTRIGRLIDPLIDRALLATAGLTMLALDIIPGWVIILIVIRDVALVATSLWLFGGTSQIPVNRVGKFGTACLLIGIPGFLLGHMDWSGAQLWGRMGWAFTIVGLVTYYIAGVMYARDARALVQLRRQAGAAATDDTPDPGADQ